MKWTVLIIGLIIFFTSCGREEFTDIPIDSKIVVEGWIEQGDVAKVILMHSVPLTAVVDSTNFQKYVIRSATVTVSDGMNEDTLRLRTSSAYLPPYIYEGEKIRGAEGKKYTLTVKYLDTILNAETTIPSSVSIRDIQYKKEHPTDTVGKISIWFSDPVDQHNYYQIATRVEGADDIFIPALYGNLNDENFTSSDVEFKITRGITIFPETNFEPHFTDGDHIYVKLRTMTKEGFDFWNSWQNEIINAQNPIFPANKSLKSNIKGGGLGVWCGYGQDSRLIVAK